jgi:exodeoxyribonuclease-1
MLSKAHLYSAIMLPVAPHPTNSNGVICYDLSADPEPLITLDADQIRERLFSPREQLPEAVEPIPLKVVHLNKSPVVMPVKVVDSAVSKRLEIDPQRCHTNWQRLAGIDLQRKLQQVFAPPKFPSQGEAEQQLYQGFLPNRDKPLLEQIRTASVEDFKQQSFHFSDDRYNRLLFNYRARYFPQSLSAQEQAQWAESCRWRLSDPESGYLTLDQQRTTIAELLSNPELPEDKRSVLNALLVWNRSVADEFGLE